MNMDSLQMIYLLKSCCSIVGLPAGNHHLWLISPLQVFTYHLMVKSLVLSPSYPPFVMINIRVLRVNLHFPRVNLPIFADEITVFPMLLLVLEAGGVSRARREATLLHWSLGFEHLLQLPIVFFLVNFGVLLPDCKLIITIHLGVS